MAVLSGKLTSEWQQILWGKLQERFALSQHKLQQNVPDLQAYVIECWISGL